MWAALLSRFAFTIGPASPAFGLQRGKTKFTDPVCAMQAAHPQSSACQGSARGRGEKGMGFSQTATTHHFFLKPDGGMIQVEVNDPADAINRARIRAHLKHIAQAFNAGDFAIPMFVHGTEPPGVPAMKRLREEIGYAYIETPNGGRVLISSSNGEAIRAVHRFLTFQIEEHKTGDPAEAR